MKKIPKKEILKAIKCLDEANVPTDSRCFWLDLESPIFKQLKQKGRIKEVEPGLWEIL